MQVQYNKKYVSRSGGLKTFAFLAVIWLCLEQSVCQLCGRTAGRQDGRTEV